MADRTALERPGRHQDHGRHDRALVAAAADRGGRLSGALDACSECRSLLGDLRALAAAVPMSAVPHRPRDLRLTTEAAARLRRGGWRRILAAIGTGRDAVTRPLALSLTTLGLAGLLLSAFPAGLPLGGSQAADLGGAGSVPQPLRSTDGEAAPGPAGVAVPTLGPSVEGPVVGVSVAGGTDGPPGTADGLAVRFLALAFLGLGLGTAALRRVASTRRRMR